MEAQAKQQQHATKVRAVVLQCFHNVHRNWYNKAPRCGLIQEATVEGSHGGFFGADSDEESEAVSRTLSAVRWFILVPSLRLEGVAQLNLLLRDFTLKLSDVESDTKQKEIYYSAMVEAVDLVDLQEVLSA